MPRVSIGFSGAVVFGIRDYNTPIRSSGHEQLSEVRAHLVHNLGPAADFMKSVHGADLGFVSVRFCIFPQAAVSPTPVAVGRCIFPT